jgi:hypothetical protein
VSSVAGNARNPLCFHVAMKIVDGRKILENKHGNNFDVRGSWLVMRGRK